MLIFMHSSKKGGHICFAAVGLSVCLSVCVFVGPPTVAVHFPNRG